MPSTIDQRSTEPLLPLSHFVQGSTRETLGRVLGQAGPIIGLIGVIILFSALRPRTFPTKFNAQIILMNTAVVATAALGMTIVIVGGGIDLSVGSTIALTTVVVAEVIKLGRGTGMGIAAGLGIAVAAGLLNGLLITYVRLLPFIVTLGTMAILRGLALKLADQNVVILDRPTWLNQVLQMVNKQHNGWMLVPPGVWMTVMMAVIVALWLRYTRTGRHVYAIGSNEQTARLCGIHVDRVKILTYVLLGLFSGIAGLLEFGFLNSEGDPGDSVGKELDVIAAVVIGGASLTGGQGTILGTLVGALIMAVVSNGLIKVGMKDPDKRMIVGAIIIVAVTIDRLQHRGRKN